MRSTTPPPPMRLCASLPWPVWLCAPLPRRCLRACALHCMRSARLSASQCAPERFTAHARDTAPVQLKSTRHSRPLADRWAKAKECPECSRLSATNCNTNLKTMSRCNCHANSRPYHVRTGPPRCAAVDKTSPTRAYRTVLAQHFKRQYRKKII